MGFWAEIKFRYPGAARLGPAGTCLCIRGLFESGMPGRLVTSLQEAAVRAVDHGVAEAALVDEEGWRTDGESFDRRESKRLTVSHAHNSSGAAHQRCQLRRAKAWGDPHPNPARTGVIRKAG